MSEEIQARLFTRFFSTKAARGTGLGLAVVKKITEEHGGTLGINSALGKGSEFHIHLPRMMPKYSSPEMGIQSPVAPWTSRAACYRCLYPEPPPADLVPSCAEGGVLGVLPGIVGLVQAIESIKLIFGKGESLIGRLLLFDAMGMQFSEVRLHKDEKCPVCGVNPSIRELIDYEQFCGVSASVEEDLTPDEVPLDAQVFAEQVKQSQVFLLDVREPHEWDICHIEGATLIPSGQLADRLAEIDGSKRILVYCRDGSRSLDAIRLLYSSGYTSVRHLKGGILAWIDKIDASLPRY